MNNNINNLRFNAVNFGSKGEKNDAEEVVIRDCDCPECKATEADAADALDAIGRVQVRNTYKSDPKNTKDDAYEHGEIWADCILDIFQNDIYNGLVNEGMDPDTAWEEASRAARCLNPNR